MPNKHLHPETFAHYLLFIFYPFRNENSLKVNNSYCQKLDEKCVLHTINENKRFFDLNNVFVRLSQVRNEISDVDLSVDYDDSYLTEKNEELSKKE